MSPDGEPKPRSLDDFRGRWRLEREIVDLRAEATSRLEGVADLAPCEVGLRYEERGRLHLPDGQVLTAVRRYLWQEAGGRIVVTFEDGRAFHDFDPTARGPQAVHFCDPDDYAVRYDFTGWPMWTAAWRVRGPRKDYRMQSRYRPD